MKTFLTPAIILICIAGNWMQADAQVQQAWVQQYVESEGDHHFSVAIKTDGSSIYVLGVKYTLGEEPDALLIKYTNSGTLVWEQTYNGPNDYQDVPTAMELDGAGNIYVVGTSRFYNTESTSETFTLKYNAGGTLLWSSRYLRPDNNPSNLTSVAVDAAGNVYVTGHTDGGSSYYDFLTIKYNSSGVQQWIRTFNGTNSGFDGNTLVALDAAGNIYVTGESEGKTVIQGFPLFTGQDFRTIKYDPNGNTLWSKKTGTFGDDAPKSIVVMGSHIYISGEGNGPFETDYLTVKYDANGTLVWSTSYNGPADADDQCRAMVVNSAGECYVTGLSRETDGKGNYRTIKYSAGGVQLWQQSYGGASSLGAGASAIALDGSGNIYVTGSCIDTNDVLEIATIKYTSSGTKSWVMVYNGSPASYDLPYAIAVYTPPGSPLLNRPSVYVTGDFQTVGNNTDYLLTIRYTQNLIIGPLSSAEVTNYPNPFGASTTIVYELTEESEVSLQIVDLITGRQIESISLGRQNAGERHYLYRPENLPKGNYVYTIVAASVNGRSIQRNVMRVGE